jgi:NAD(P)H-hydrate repair Nnr-like enzyme with NAD(P)H-hydrate dehydratase domain
MNGTYIKNEGTPRLATAGSGDVLAGILVAAAARVVAEVEQTSGGDVSANDHIDWAKITAAGVILHGLAGRLAAGELLGDSGSRPLSASQVALAVPGVHAYLAGDR